MTQFFRFGMFYFKIKSISIIARCQANYGWRINLSSCGQRTEVRILSIGVNDKK